MQYVVTEDAGPRKVHAVMLQWLQCPLQFPEFGCSAHAVVAVAHKLDVVCCDGRYTAHEGGCCEPVLNAVRLQCDFSCMQSPNSGCSGHCIVRERGCCAQSLDAVYLIVYAVGCDRECSAHEVDAVSMC